MHKNRYLDGLVVQLGLQTLVLCHLPDGLHEGLHYFVRKRLLENVRNVLLENFRNFLLEIVLRKSHLGENVRNLLEFVRNDQEGWKMSEIWENVRNLLDFVRNDYICHLKC